jgi:Flp pilus assembly protein TadG
MSVAMIQRAMAHVRRCRRSMKKLRSDTSGLAAVEFALIIPLMLMMFFGMIDVSSGFAVDRKISSIAQTLSDLTSRYPVVAETDVTNFFTIADAMLTPYDSTILQATISQIYMDPASKTAKVVWSRGDAKLAKDKVVTIPTDLIAKDSSGNWNANQYLILAQATYLYKPTIGWVVSKAGITLGQSSFTKPRQSVCVKIGDPTTGSCTPSAG